MVHRISNEEWLDAAQQGMMNPVERLGMRGLDGEGQTAVDDLNAEVRHHIERCSCPDLSYRADPTYPWWDFGATAAYVEAGLKVNA